MMNQALTFDDVGVPLIEATFVVLDLETTGLDPATDAITEIGAVKIRGGEVLGELGTLVRPFRPIPARITRLTGIDDAMVEGAPSIGEVLASLEPFMLDATLVAHNARFDHAFLLAAARRHAYRFDPPVIDTVRLARRLLRNEVPNLRLATLADRLGVAVRPDHRALNDARATVEVFHRLLERAGSLGATTLEDLRALTRSSSDRRFRKIDLVAHAPRSPGIYMFRSADDTVLYIGKATNLRQRLRSYFTSDERRGIDALVRQTRRVTWQTTPTVIEAEVTELRAIHRFLPRFNRRSTRPLPGWYVAVTDEPLPRLSVVRSPGARHRAHVGPLASRGLAARFAEAASRALGLRECTPRLRKAQDHQACALKALDQCDAPCDGSLTSTDYAPRVEAFTQMIDDPSRALAAIERRMRIAADTERFERAVDEREALFALAGGLWEHRRLDMLASCSRLLVTRPRRPRVRGDEEADLEVLVIVEGALAHTFVVALGSNDDEIIERSRMLPSASAVGHPPDLRERRVVAAALDDPDVRVVHVEGRLASRVTGGRALHQLVADARASRHLVGAHPGSPDGATGRQRSTMSNQGLSASMIAGSAPTSRASQRTRAR